MMLKYLFLFLSISFSNLVFADGFKSHVYNVSPYPVKAWANYLNSNCSSYPMEINPNTPSWDWSPPPGCGNIPIKNINYEFTDKNGVKQTYWIPGGNINRDIDVCIYGDPIKDVYYFTGKWLPCKPYDEICKDPAYGMSSCTTRTGRKPD